MPSVTLMRWRRAWGMPFRWASSWRTFRLICSGGQAGGVLPANNTSGAFPFSNFSPFGFNGRFVYARVALNW